MLASTVLLAVARAALFAAQDWYWSRGLRALSAQGFARHVLTGLPLALAACALAALLGRGRRARLPAAAALALVAYLFLTARLPYDLRHAPGFHDLDALAAHIGSLVLALVVARHCTAPAASPRARRIAAFAAAVPVLLALGVMASGMRSSSAPLERPNVILISLDTLRADRLGACGGPAGTTPNIDRFFGASSAVFRAAFAPQPFTLTSHASILTGLEPSEHGVGEKAALPSGVPTLAEHLSRAGYVTVADVDPIEWLDPRYGFERGFQRYQQRRGTARERVPALEELLDDLGDERFFLFLHFYDAHSDSGPLAYDSEPEDRVAVGLPAELAFRARDERGGGTGLLWAANQGERVLTKEERAQIALQYDAGVRSLDRALGPLLEKLERDGFLEDTLVILLSDHGEELFEHEKWLHTQLYDECVHVPLLVRVPDLGAVHANDDVVGLADVTPTVLELCGVTADAPMQGKSLVPLLHGTGAAPREHVVLEWDGLGLRTREWKLLLQADARQLFHLSEDPGERVDRAAFPGFEDELARLTEELRAEAEHGRELGDAVHPRKLQPLAAATKETLRALGYAGGDE